MVWWENIRNTCWFVFVEWKIGLSTREVRSAMSFALLHFVRQDLMNTNCVLWCQWTALPTTTIVWMCGGNWFECYVRSFVRCCSMVAGFKYPEKQCRRHQHRQQHRHWRCHDLILLTKSTNSYQSQCVCNWHVPYYTVTSLCFNNIIIISRNIIIYQQYPNISYNEHNYYTQHKIIIVLMNSNLICLSYRNIASIA